MHDAARWGHSEIVQLLLLAGADPTIRNNARNTPLNLARSYNNHSCILLLQAALAEPQRPRSLLKTRVRIDVAQTSRILATHLTAKELPAEVQREILGFDGVFRCINRRTALGQALPRVEVVGVVGGAQGGHEEVVACVKYALFGMPRGAFMGLCELLVPKWDRADV